MVLVFQQNRNSPILWALGCAVLAIQFMLQLQSPPLSVAFLAGPILLGPVANVQLGGLLVHLGDLAIGAAVVATVLREGSTTKLPLGRHRTAVLALVLLTLICWSLSLDAIASSPSMVALFEMFALYVLTVGGVKTRRDIEVVLRAWAAAIALASWLVIFSYLQGRPLLLGAEAPVDNSALESIASLYRATFFTTGFGYPLSAAILLSSCWLLLGSGRPRTNLLIAIGLLLDGVALGLIASATTAAAVVAGLGALVLWGLTFRGAAKRLVWFVFVLSAAIAVASVSISSIVSPSQLALLVGRTQNAESLFARFYVWANVGRFLLEQPKTLIFGLGPDISIRRGDHEFVRQMFYGGGAQQNAVDSGYLYLLLNYGLLIFIVILGTVTQSLTTLARRILRADQTALALWLSIFVWLIMALTQQGGVSKPLFILPQFVALAAILVQSVDPGIPNFNG